MAKICPHCGNEMPDEASFCLKCFSVIKIQGVSAEQIDECKKFVENNTKAFSVPTCKKFNHTHTKKKKNLEKKITDIDLSATGVILTEELNNEVSKNTNAFASLKIKETNKHKAKDDNVIKENINESEASPLPTVNNKPLQEHKTDAQKTKNINFISSMPYGLLAKIHIKNEKKTDSCVLTSADEKVNKKYNKKKVAAIVSSCAVCFVILLSLSLVLRQDIINKSSNEPITKKVLVTESDGTAVTDTSGENVYEIVETTTEKQSFWEKLVAAVTPSNDNDALNEESQGAMGFESTTLGDLNASENTSGNPSNGTSQESNPTTAVTPSETTTETIIDDKNFSDNFNYEILNDAIRITKYIGNSTNVVVPAYICGKYVNYIGANAFSDNDKIETISFEDSESTANRSLYFEDATIFNNLENLKSIALSCDTSAAFCNKNGERMSGYYTELYNIFNKLPSLESVDVNGRTGDNYFYGVFSVDGVLYGQAYVNGNSRFAPLYYPQNKQNSIYIVPKKATIFYSLAFKENKHLEKIVLHKQIKDVVNNTYVGCDSINCFEMESGNISGYFSKDGVLFGNLYTTINDQSFRAIFAYPAAKKDAVLKIEDDGGLPYLISTGFNSNPYLKELILPPARIQLDFFSNKTAPKNVSKITLPASSPFIDYSIGVARDNCELVLY